MGHCIAAVHTTHDASRQLSRNFGGVFGDVLRPIFRTALCASGCLAPQDVIANVVVSTTRAVVELLSGDAAIRLRNAREAPALVQLWVDIGDIASIPDTSDAPFELTPSLFVLDAGQTQAEQLHYDGEPLPDHNERLYWINLLDVPAREHTDERSYGNASATVRRPAPSSPRPTPRHSTSRAHK
jgi:P pilus assembly chaperone PapD